MNNLQFNLTKRVNFDGFEVLIDPRMKSGKSYDGIARAGHGPVRLLKDLLWPLVSLRNRILVDGFIEAEAGRLIKKYAKKESTFLDLGCGDLRLKKYIPKYLRYSGFDVSLSEVRIRRALKKGEQVNLALASAKNIPLPSNSVDLAATTEVYEHIPGVKDAIKETYRILKPGGTLVVSIPNNYCYKYQKKGPHADHVNNWTYEEFKKLMSGEGFEFLEGSMKGFWIPLPSWIARASYQLPIHSKNEFYNTNFFYVFRKRSKK